MKRILIIIENISSSGGTERVASLLSSELSKKKYKVTLLTKENKKPYYDLYPDVTLVSLKKNTILYYFLFLIKNKFDIIIPISMGKLGFISSILHKILNLDSKLYISEHISFDSSKWYIKKLKLFAYMLADKVILLTNKDKSTIEKWTKTDITVIRNPSVYEPIDSNAILNKEKVVLAIGRFTYQKNFQELLNIWHGLSPIKTSGWKLKIIGSGEDKCDLENLINIYNLNDSVEILPPQKNVDLFYKESSILAMTSRYEGLPLVLIEAKSFALVSISYDCETGPSEIINDDYDGYIIDNLDRNKYIVKLEELMMNQNERERMQINALINSRSYSVDSIIKLWESIL